MATSSDQIQAEIARTRARMASSMDQVGRPYGNAFVGGAVRPAHTVAGGVAPTGGGSLVDQVRQRPLLALGLGLIAGSLLQDYMGGGSQVSTRPTYPDYGIAPTGREAIGSVRGTVSSAAYSVGDAAQSVGDAAQSAGHAVVDTAQDAAGTVRDAVSSAVDTTVDVAQRVTDTTVDAAQQAFYVAGDVAGDVTERVGDAASTISDFVSDQPLIAVGLSLVAGSLLQRYLRGGQARTDRTYSQYPSPYADYPVVSSYTGTNAYRGVGQTTQGVANTVGDAAQRGAHVASNVAGAAVDTASNVAGAAVDTASNVAGAAVDTASNVAGAAVDAVTGAAGQVADTAGSAAHYVADTVTDLWPAITRQVQDRPLMTLAVAIGAGMLLQPTLSPHIKAISADVSEFWNGVSGSVGDIAQLPEPDEVQRIKAAIVPATVERTRQLLNHQVRDYLETTLEGYIGQASLRAGAVAAITDKAEEFIDARLPNVLNGVGGTTGLVLLGLTGAVLEAQDQARQGQGSTVGNVRTQLSQSIVQNAQEQLSRYFPEFRQELQSQGEQRTAGQQDGSEQCPNCGSQVAPNSRFCPNCGKSMTE